MFGHRRLHYGPTGYNPELRLRALRQVTSPRPAVLGHRRLHHALDRLRVGGGTQDKKMSRCHLPYESLHLPHVACVVRQSPALWSIRLRSPTPLVQNTNSVSVGCVVSVGFVFYYAGFTARTVPVMRRSGGSISFHRPGSGLNVMVSAAWTDRTL